MSSTKTMTLAIKTEHCTLAGSVREVDPNEPDDVSGDDWVLTYTPEEFYKLGHEYAALKGDQNRFNRLIGRNIIDFIDPYYDDADAHAQPAGEPDSSSADALISRSAQQNEIVHADYNKDLADDLATESDNGGTRTGDETEYWGTTDGGSDWRVHLDHAPAGRDEPDDLVWGPDDCKPDSI